MNSFQILTNVTKQEAKDHCAFCKEKYLDDETKDGRWDVFICYACPSDEEFKVCCVCRRLVLDDILYQDKPILMQYYEQEGARSYYKVDSYSPLNYC